MPESLLPQKPAQKSVLHARFIVWISGLLLALSIASYLAARITHLNQTVDILGAEDAIWSEGTSTLLDVITSWSTLSLLAIPICFLVYLSSLAWYQFDKKKRTPSPEISPNSDTP